MDTYLKGKNVLYITTKNPDYLRIVQELRIISESAASYKTISSSSSSYLIRVLLVYFQILICRSKDYDCVFVGFAPQLILPFWRWKWRKKEITIDFFISVYDTMVFDRKRFKKGSFAARICFWLDKKTLSAAGRIIADTKAHADYFSGQFQADRHLFSVLYLEADRSVFYPRDEKKEENKDFFDVLYFGSILPLQGIQIIQAAAQMLAEEKIRFWMIGPVKESEKVKSDNIIYIPWLEHEALADRIAGADLCLAGHFNDQIDKAKRTIPGKAYIYEAMKKKMILGDGPANRELFSDDTNHIFVRMGDARALANAIRAAKADAKSTKNKDANVAGGAKK